MQNLQKCINKAISVISDRWYKSELNITAKFTFFPMESGVDPAENT